MKDDLTQIPFALILSAEGIALAYRSGEGWEGVGELDPTSPTLAEGLAALRDKAETRAPGRLRTKLVIPDDQVRYVSLELGLIDEDQRHARVRRALDGATPYALDELVYDIAVDGPVTHVAAVAIETLREAEEFARSAGFNPASFGALPGAAGFPGEAFFGAAGSFDDAPAAEPAKVAPSAPPTPRPAKAAPEPSEAQADPAQAKATADAKRRRTAMITIALGSVILVVAMLSLGMFSSDSDPAELITPAEETPPTEEQSGAIAPEIDAPLPTRTALIPVPTSFQPSAPVGPKVDSKIDPQFARIEQKIDAMGQLTLADLAVPSSATPPRTDLPLQIFAETPARFAAIDQVATPRVELANLTAPAITRATPTAEASSFADLFAALPTPAPSLPQATAPDLPALILSATSPEAADAPGALALPVPVQEAPAPRMAQLQGPDGDTAAIVDAALAAADIDAEPTPEEPFTIVELTSTANVVMPRLRPVEPESPLTLAEREALSLAALSTPRLRPVVEKPDVAVYQVASSGANLPRLRPAGLVVPQPQLAGSVRASTAAVQGEQIESGKARATPRSQRITPQVASSKRVQKSATQRNQLRMNRVSLLGVSGSASKRKALVRMPSGRIRKLEIGDSIDGGRVVAIGKSELRYLKSGQNLTLKMPRS